MLLGEQYFCSGCWMCFFPTEEFVWRLAACESIHVAHLIGCSPCCLAGASIKESNVKFRFWTLPWLWKHIPEKFKLKHKTCWNVPNLFDVHLLGNKKCCSQVSYINVTIVFVFMKFIFGIMLLDEGKNKWNDLHTEITTIITKSTHTPRLTILNVNLPINGKWSRPRVYNFKLLPQF